MFTKPQRKYKTRRFVFPVRIDSAGSLLSMDETFTEGLMQPMCDAGTLIDICGLEATQGEGFAASA